jgi:hypothetical protein
MNKSVSAYKIAGITRPLPKKKKKKKKEEEEKEKKEEVK